MKTKIIYISGNEVFEMSEIRAAFDSVRATLGLDNDTILFGVPVDADNALACTNDVNETKIDVKSEPAIEKPIVLQAETEQPAEPEIEQIEEITEVIPEQEKESEKVIPILSILSPGDNSTETIVEQNVEPVVEVDPQAEVTTNESAIISDINIDAELSSPVENANNDDVIETVSISDMITDAPPAPQQEQTLEQLLESMTPLREDVQQTTQINDVPPIDVFDGDDTDATLAQLATEFADNQDKILTVQKNSSTGKIGKLKNILPFKKARRDENSLMGDLFGWAGIAANDEDFSIPGFFTPAASKKQGA